MRAVLHDGAKIYEIGRHVGLRDRRPVRPFYDEVSARTFLLRFTHDPSNMAAFRTVLREEYQGALLTRFGDRQVVEAVSRLLAAGALRLILRPEEPPAPFAGGDLGQSRQATQPSPRRVVAEAPAPSPPPVTPPPEDSELPADVDAAAIAAIMRQAARDGIPFCEE